MRARAWGALMGGRYRVVVWGRGTAVEVRDMPRGLSVFVQGDDASDLLADLDSRGAEAAADWIDAAGEATPDDVESWGVTDVWTGKSWTGGAA